MSSMKWEMALKRVDELRAQNNGNLHEWVMLLKQVWEDSRFLAFHRGDVKAAEDHLNQKLGDYGLDIHMAFSILKHFPEKESWEKGNIVRLTAAALEKDREEQKDASGPKQERKGPIARAQHEAVLQQMKHINSRADSLAEENGRLRAENAILRSELDRSTGRITELERILKREFVSA